MISALRRRAEDNPFASAEPYPMAILNALRGRHGRKQGIRATAGMAAFRKKEL